MGHKGHYGQYTGNAKWSRDHAHTKVTKENYDATKRDDEAHMQYLKEDVDYDDKHGHSDEKMTADEKHISKLAGDLKYDEKHHGSPAHQNLSEIAKEAAVKGGQEAMNELVGTFTKEKTEMPKVPVEPNFDKQEEINTIVDQGTQTPKDA